MLSVATMMLMTATDGPTPDYALHRLFIINSSSGKVHKLALTSCGYFRRYLQPVMVIVN